MGLGLFSRRVDFAFVRGSRTQFVLLCRVDWEEKKVRLSYVAAPVWSAESNEMSLRLRELLSGRPETLLSNGHPNTYRLQIGSSNTDTTVAPDGTSIVVQLRNSIVEEKLSLVVKISFSEPRKLRA